MRYKAIFGTLEHLPAQLTATNPCLSSRGWFVTAEDAANMALEYSMAVQSNHAGNIDEADRVRHLRKIIAEWQKHSSRPTKDQQP